LFKHIAFQQFPILFWRTKNIFNLNWYSIVYIFI
jgi:hypothetical protein